MKLELKSSGPQAVYCSPRCRTAACRARAKTQLPKQMRDQPRWTAANGKRPVTVKGAPASSTNPATWTTYDQVKDQDHGIMLGGGIGCIDLDHCLTPRGKVKDWAKPILAACKGAVIEKSLSGRGLHIFGLMLEAPGHKYGSVEVYSRQRFIRTTERIWRAGKLIDLAPAAALAGQLFKRGAIPAHP